MPKQPLERFPGFARSLAMLRHRKDAETQEAGYHWLLPRVNQFVGPLLTELEAEADQYVQGWILELLGEARDSRAFPAFIQHLHSSDASVRFWAESGLRKLTQTREGRKVLWSALQQQEGLPATPSTGDERTVREALDRVLRDPG